MDEVIFRLAQILDALGNGVRLDIVLLLRENERLCVSKIAEELDRTSGSISHQLEVLAAQGLVRAESEGRNRIYEIRRDDIVDKILEILPLITRSEDS